MKRDTIPLIKYIIKFSNPSWLDVYFSWRQQKLNLEPAARSVDVSAAVPRPPDGHDAAKSPLPITTS